MDKIIVFAFPVFGLLMLGEIGYGIARGRNTYRINDALASLSQGILSQITVVFTNIFHIGVYAFALSHLALVHPLAFWDTSYGWLLALILADFCGYWHHRFSHEVALLWAAHVVHHQSQDFNFSTALRQESAYPILESIFYLPLAVLGVPTENFALALLVILLYQVWIHTEHVGRLGWFDRVFSSPSNHRVHHAINDSYLDRNYGGVLIIWDRLFGTFAAEGEEKCIYGTRPLLNTWDPVWANLVIYWCLLRDAWRAQHWRDKLRIWFMPPGWLPKDVAERYPVQPFDMREVHTFDPDLDKSALLLACAQFLLLAGASAVFLWYMDDLGFARDAALVGALCAGLWVLGRVIEGGMRLGGALLIDAGLIAATALVL